jgi:hypothetical protein
MTSVTGPSDLEGMLATLQPGKAVHVPYQAFAELFPPGVEDDGAKGRAYDLAKRHGCVIENRKSTEEVLFVKSATSE